MLKRVDATEFGSFSVLMVASQLVWGIGSAMFCAPLPTILNRKELGGANALIRSMSATNMVAALAIFLIFGVLGLILKVQLSAAFLFAAFTSVGMLRWFARAESYAREKPLAATLSDLIYSVSLAVGVLGIIGSSSNTQELAYLALALSVLIGLVPFGLPYLAQQLHDFTLHNIRRYGEIWHQSSRWSVLGVLTTEATANAHVYIVTLVYGPSAYAPIAASALMIRPINVAMNALTEFERAQMARQIGADRTDLALASVRFFRYVLITIWVGTIVVVAGLLTYAPNLIFPSQYSMSLLITGVILWMLVTGVRLLRTPDSVLLQAAGSFRQLALASVSSAGASVIAVVLLLATAGQLWSIAGILIGEGLFAVCIWREAATWLTSRVHAALPNQSPKL